MTQRTIVVTGHTKLTRRQAQQIDKGLRALGASLVENDSATGDRWWVTVRATLAPLIADDVRAIVANHQATRH